VSLNAYKKAYKIYTRVLARDPILKSQIEMQIEARQLHEKQYGLKKKFKVKDLSPITKVELEAKHQERLRCHLMLRDYHQHKMEKMLFRIAVNAENEGLVNSENLKSAEMVELRVFTLQEFTNFGWGAQRTAEAQIARFVRLIEGAGLEASCIKTDNGYTLSANCEEWAVDLLKRLSQVGEWVSIMEEFNVNPRAIMPSLPYGSMSWER